MLHNDMSCTTTLSNGPTNTRCISRVSGFNFLLISLFSAFLLSDFSSWEPLPAVIDWPSWDLCVSMEDGWRNPSPTVKHNPARSKPLRPTHFHISPPLWILIWKFGVDFLWLSLHYFLFSVSLLSTLSWINLSLVFSISLFPHINIHIKRASLHLLAVPFIISFHFINPRRVWSACWHCRVQSV